MNIISLNISYPQMVLCTSVPSKKYSIGSPMACILEKNLKRMFIKCLLVVLPAFFFHLTCIPVVVKQWPFHLGASCKSKSTEFHQCEQAQAVPAHSKCCE